MKKPEIFKAEIHIRKVLVLHIKPAVLTLGAGDASAFFPRLSGLTSGWSVCTWLSRSSKLSNFTPHSGHLSPDIGFSNWASPGVTAPPCVGLWPFVLLVGLNKAAPHHDVVSYKVLNTGDR